VSLPEDELVGVTIAQATRGSYLKAYNRLNHRPTSVREVQHRRLRETDIWSL